MTEEEKKLTILCYEIGYELELKEEVGYMRHQYGIGKPCNTNLIRHRNVREIIFTPEFMEKFFEKCEEPYQDVARDLILKHLDNPVDYLYSLIK